MNLARMTFASIGLAVLMLSACDRAEPAGPPPAAVEASDEAAGYYCGMLLSDHDGPKGQVHLASRDEPVWFSSVRDTIAFLRLPEEPSDVVAVYVNDMGKAQQWNQPEPGTWVDAHAAWFVVESSRQGGMGAPEAVPFSTEPAAEAFRDSHGGRILRLDDIPDDFVIGPVDLSSSMHGPDDGHAAADHGQHDHGNPPGDGDGDGHDRASADDDEPSPHHDH